MFKKDWHILRYKLYCLGSLGNFVTFVKLSGTRFQVCSGNIASFKAVLVPWDILSLSELFLHNLLGFGKKFSK